MEQSILKSVKKMLGLASDYTVFDLDVTMHTNSALSTLTQLGVGPEGGFAIEDDSAEWIAFLGTDPKINQVKSFVFLYVKKLFDPPGTSFAIEAMDKQLLEMSWRLNTAREPLIWTDPYTGRPEDLDSILDGGSP